MSSQGGIIGMACPFWPNGMGVMPSNNGGMHVGYLAGKYEGRIGWLISPGGFRTPPEWLPYALDNGAFGAWVNKHEWDEGAFTSLLERSRNCKPPLWVVVPDVVANRYETLKRWVKWAPIVRSIMHGVKLAFAVQDGMTASDVPTDADVVFVGGTTEWKWKHLRMWADSFPRVHVARVNSERLLWQADDSGCESCDGTGWMRGNQEQLDGLERYLRMSHRADHRPQMVMEALL